MNLQLVILFINFDKLGKTNLFFLLVLLGALKKYLLLYTFWGDLDIFFNISLHEVMLPWGTISSS